MKYFFCLNLSHNIIIMSLAYIRSCQAICKYCKGEGHTKPNCPHALGKALEIMDAIDLIINSRRREEERLFHLFNAELLTDLCFFMNTPRSKEFIHTLVQTGKITEAVSNMRYKQDRVTVLMWIFWFSSKEYKDKQDRLKRKITIKTPETVTDLSAFECPICVSELPAKEKVETGCKHCICKSCFVTCLEHQILNKNYLSTKCSMCRADIIQVTISNPEYIDEVVNLVVLM